MESFRKWSCIVGVILSLFTAVNTSDAAVPDGWPEEINFHMPVYQSGTAYQDGTMVWSDDKTAWVWLSDTNSDFDNSPRAMQLYPNGPGSWALQWKPDIDYSSFLELASAATSPADIAGWVIPQDAGWGLWDDWGNTLGDYGADFRSGAGATPEPASLALISPVLLLLIFGRR